MTSTDSNAVVPMDPQLKSMITSAELGAAGLVAGWAVHAGIVTAADQSALAAQLVAIGAGIVAIAVAWYKRRQMSQTAMIQHINAADNGVKVVSVADPGIPVSGPLKGN